MNELTDKLFSTEIGKKLYENALSAISDYSMHSFIKKGVLVGLSGGADSVALLFVLLKYRQTHDFKLKAVHVNHGIRGDEADRDEIFSRELCEKLGIDFSSYRIDVPEISKNNRIGLEEAARNERYRIFSEIISSDEEISTVAVAHNATDNLETVIFNMMRGSGLSGVSGISPKRDNIIRPLIYSPKSEISEALTLCGIDYVTDSTNLSSDYSRNYIRNEIIPKLKKINNSPESMCTRLTKTLREDNAYLVDEAKAFIEEKVINGKAGVADLILLKKPIFSRVFSLLTKKSNFPSPEKTHIDKIYGLLTKGDFTYSLPGGVSFISRCGVAYIGKIENAEDFYFEIQEGVNTFSDFSSVVILTDDLKVDCYSNIYKISIQVKLNSDIISSGLYIRSKKDGDAYCYGGMTRKLKKLFNDKKVSLYNRSNVPIFCDREGILWVPGLKVRDGAQNGKTWYIIIAEPHNTEPNKRSFYTLNH